MTRLLLHRTLRLSLWLSLIGLALVLLALRFWLLPRSDQFRHPLEKSLSLYLHQPVRIGHLQAGLDGIAPKLRLIAVAVGPPEEARLQFEEVEIKLDLPASLRTGRLQPAQVKILGARIEIAQDANGRFHVLGLPAGGKELIPAWLLQDGRFELLGGTLVWHVGSRPRLWRNLDLRLANRGPEHRLWARFAAPEALAEQASVSAKIQGDPNTPNWEAEFQIHLKQWQLTGLKAFLPGEFRRNLQGQGTLTLQGTWRPARWQATAEVDLHRLTWRPSWLAQPLELHHLRGQIRGHWDNNGWQVHAQPLHLNNADFEAYAQLRLARPAQEAPYLALSADFRRLKLANLDAYLPSRATPGLVRWLARKPLHGTVSGHLVWRGRWPGFPLRDLSEARLSGPRVRIEFHPSWPALAATDLSLTSRDGRITLAAHRGQLADVPIESLSASLDSTASDPVLTIQGHSRTSVANLLKVLERSPLAPAVAKLTAKTRLAGRAAVLLDISLPVQRPKEYQIDGRVELQQAAWQLTEQALGLNALSGELRFSRHRLTARLHGKLGQQPAHLEADVDRDRTRLTLLTQLTPEVLPSAALRPLVKGTTSAELALELSHTPNTPARLRLRSQLQGLAVHLPYPLGKRADQSQALELIAQLRSPEVPVRLNYGPVHAALRLNPRTSELYGQIGLNQPPPAAKGKGFVFAGQLDRLPLDSWLEFWSRWPLSSSGTGRLRQLELNAEHVHLQGKNLGAHRVQAQRVESGWKGALTAPYAAGDWTWESRTKRLSLRLDFIDLDKLSQLAQNPKLPRYSPATPWPALTLHAQRLRWRKHDLGALTFKTFPEAAQVPFELTLAGSWHRLEASGRWRQAEPTATQVSGRFSSQDLGKFLQHIGYSTALAQTPTTLDFKLDWPGAPQFSVAKLNGFAHLETGPGRWLDADPKAARLLGLLYLGTLERRLRLDFSDLFQAGLAYERIGGRIRIKDGLALTDDLSIAAISARIHIAGTVDLVNHQVDEYVTVSPNTPATLGLFREYSSNGLGKMANFTQRLINAPLDSVTQSQYAIYGTLDNPTIVLLRRSLPGAMLHGIWSKLQGLTGNPNE